MPQSFHQDLRFESPANEELFNRFVSLGNSVIDMKGIVQNDNVLSLADVQKLTDTFYNLEKALDTLRHEVMGAIREREND